MKQNKFEVYFKTGTEIVKAQSALEALMKAMLLRSNSQDRFALRIEDVDLNVKFDVNNDYLFRVIN